MDRRLIHTKPLPVEHLWNSLPSGGQSSPKETVHRVVRYPRRDAHTSMKAFQIYNFTINIIHFFEHCLVIKISIWSLESSLNLMPVAPKCIRNPILLTMRNKPCCASLPCSVAWDLTLTDTRNWWMSSGMCCRFLVAQPLFLILWSLLLLNKQ